MGPSFGIPMHVGQKPAMTQKLQRRNVSERKSPGRPGKDRARLRNDLQRGGSILGRSHWDGEKIERLIRWQKLAEGGRDY